MIPAIIAILLAVTAHAENTSTQEAPPASAAAMSEQAKATQSVEGPIAKVVAKKKEIYVQGADKKHEFYFKPETTLTQNGQPAEFSVLKEGMKVRVEYVKIGKRTDPVKVEILQ